MKVHLGQNGRRLLADDKSSIQNVPAGHKGSDLSDAKCNISLQRMRDLTLRQDLKLTGASGPTALKEVFQVKSWVSIAKLMSRMVNAKLAPALDVLS